VAMREQITKQLNETDLHSKPLSEESIQQAWTLFIDSLVARKNHSAVTNFKSAELQIASENAITITTTLFFNKNS
jgi:hypothetical protein